MSYFHIGDIVQARIDLPDHIFWGTVHPGDIGIVVVGGGDNTLIGVDWGRHVHGHDCEAGVPVGNGTFVAGKNLTLAADTQDKMDIPSPNLEVVL